MPGILANTSASHSLELTSLALHYPNKEYMKAAFSGAMCYNFFGTCKKLDIAPQKWLKYVMENIRIRPAENFKELLPQFIDKSLLQE